MKTSSLRAQRGNPGFISFIIFLVLISVYTFKISSSFNVNTDFGRDIFEMQKIIGGNLTLIGPMLSAGFFASPLYFYFFAPVLALFRLSPISIVLANALIFSLAFSYMFYLFSKHQVSLRGTKQSHSTKLDIFTKFIFFISIALMPQTVYSSRNPGNAFSYIPFLLPLILYPILDMGTTKLHLFVIGLLGFVCLSFHPIAVIGILPLAFWLIFIKKSRGLLYFLIPVIASVLPTLLFEVKHNFIISRNFISGLSQYTGGLSVIASVAWQSRVQQIFNNFAFINQTISNNFSPFIILFIILSVFLFIYNFKKHTTFEKTLLVWTFTSYLLLVLIIPKYESHYLIPFNLLLLTSLYLSFSKTKYSSYLIISLTLLTLSVFPRSLYSDSVRPLSRFQDAAAFVVKKYPDLINTSFNIIQVSDEAISVPVGHEYRFYLKKRGFIPLPETDYASAKSIIVFSEVPDFRIKSLDNWEINQFGKPFKIETNTSISGVEIYLLNK